jgi:hypothetical protein
MEVEMGEEWKEGSYQHPFEDWLLKAIEQWRSDRCASWANALGENEIVENCECLSPSIEPLDKQEIFKAIEDFARRILESRPGAGDLGPLTELGTEGEWYYDEVVPLVVGIRPAVG